MSVCDCALALEMYGLTFQERYAGMFASHFLIFSGKYRATVPVRTYEHPLGWISEPVLSIAREAPTAKMVDLERHCRGLSIDVSLGVCTLPIVEKHSFENRPRRCYLACSTRTGVYEYFVVVDQQQQ